MTNTARRLSFYNTAAAAEHYLGLRWPRAVWEAVLQQAIADVVEGPSPDEMFGWTYAMADEVRAAAQNWIDDPVNEPRRFVWVCEQLDLDPAAVRAAINRKKGKLKCQSHSYSQSSSFSSSSDHWRCCGR